MYYSLQKILSYNALFNAVVGERGCGKTYAFKDWLIRDFLKTGNQGIYVRRYKSELKDIDKFFDDIKDKYPTHEFKIKGGAFYIDNKVSGFYFSLSTQVTKKSVSYPHVNKMCYDEFILDKGNIHYLPNEAEALLNLYKTVDRDNDRVRVILLANAVSQINPIFLFFSINIKENQQFTRYCENEFIVELTDSTEYKKHVATTKFSKIIKNTDYYEYSVNNKFIQDNYTFIEKKPKDSYYLCTLNFKNKMIGLWANNKTGYIYCSNSVDLTYYLKFSFTTIDHQPNYIILSQANKNDRIKMLKKAYDYGLIRYESLAIKNTMIEILKFLAIAKN